MQVVKIADFGVARVLVQSGVMTAETGTYRWMAPEVCLSLFLVVHEIDGSCFSYPVDVLSSQKAITHPVTCIPFQWIIRYYLLLVFLLIGRLLSTSRIITKPTFSALALCCGSF